MSGHKCLIITIANSTFGGLFVTLCSSASTTVVASQISDSRKLPLLSPIAYRKKLEFV